jgi:DUF1365 family protein
MNSNSALEVTMKSCLYSCEIYHDRRRPKVHAFDYRMFTFCIDLDEWDQLVQNPLISRNRWSLYSLNAADHLDFGQNSVRANLEAYLRTQGFNDPIGGVQLVTNLRTFGYQFNPVSFYFVRNADGEPAAVVAEVANTFNEQKLYLVDATSHRNGRIRDEQLKHFYISPFSDLTTRLHFNLRFPDESLDIHIHESDGDGIYFRSGMRGSRLELTTGQLLRQTLRFPAVTLQVTLAIHWHALQLFLKKVPVRAKSAHPELQTNTRTYLSRRPRHESTLAV